MNKFTHYTIIGVFTMLYLIVSFVSMFHVVDFFAMSNTILMSWILAIAFEIGAAASLASIVVADKMNKLLIWSLFILLTGMQIMGNMFSTYSNVHDYQAWIELFNLNDSDIIFQKRILSIVSGAVLPIVALGYIKALVDYLRPNEKKIGEAPLKEQEVKWPMIKDNIDNNIESNIDNDELIRSDEIINDIDSKEPELNEIEDNENSDEIINDIDSEALKQSESDAIYDEKRDKSPNKYKINTTKQQPKT